MACFLYRDAIECAIPCDECIMTKEGTCDGKFRMRKLNRDVVEYCCVQCRRLKKTNAMNSLLTDDCWDCEHYLNRR